MVGEKYKINWLKWEKNKDIIGEREPHFEKMLEDNAKLLSTYLNAYLATENFRWDDVKASFNWFRTGKVNVAHEAIDRHVKDRGG